MRTAKVAWESRHFGCKLSAAHQVAARGTRAAPGQVIFHSACRNGRAPLVPVSQS